jgi:hypothetical protein
LGVVAFLLAFEYEKEDGKHNEENKEKLINGENREEEGKKEEKKEEEKTSESEAKEQKEKKNISGKELFRLFRTKKYLMLLSFCVCGLCKYNNYEIFIY